MHKNFSDPYPQYSGTVNWVVLMSLTLILPCISDIFIFFWVNY